MSSTKQGPHITFFYRQSYLSGPRKLGLPELRRWKADGVICPVGQAGALSAFELPMVCTDLGNYETSCFRESWAAPSAHT